METSGWMDKKRFTAGQMKLQEIITSLGMETILEYQVGCYIIDIYLPEVNKGVEFDGPKHAKKRDKKRDIWVKENFDIDIFRVTDVRRLDLKDELIEFICKEI